MKLLPLLFGALQAGEKINCYWCEYVWEVFEGGVTPIKGESSCRDGALENIAQKSYSVSGTSEDKWAYATRCGYAETIGYETVYEGDKEEIKEFHIFERRGFKVPAESSLATHNGEMRLEEEGRLCGANRSECTGVRNFTYLISFLHYILRTTWRDLQTKPPVKQKTHANV